jgi:hypothetical protein
MNKELQEEGYYMAEFEFKMLGIANYLDKGRYYTAFSRISQLHHQLKTHAGLIKMPEFHDKKEEFAFYLNLQNPATGAFMDDAYPYCTYASPTGNVLLHLDALAEETGQALLLKYPLKYLDEINTPEKLVAYLNDVSTVGWIASKFPQTSFHFARDILGMQYEGDIIEKHNLYQFSPEWKQALIRWFYDNQDPETGLWGPKSKSGKLVKKDLSNTSSIIKAFVDENGKSVHAALPLRYQNELAQTILDDLFKPVPSDDELDEWHEWNLKAAKAIKSLTRYLWSGLSQEKKERTKAFIERYLALKFDKFYIPDEGAFSYYPRGKHATLDGTSDFFIFKEIGALSSEKQRRLWGGPEKTIAHLGIREISDLAQSDFNAIAHSQSVNSLRLYAATPDYGHLLSGISAILYPQNRAVLDIADFTPKIKHWISTTPQTMGNWVSKEEMVRELESLKLEEVPVYARDIPIERAEEILHKNGKLAVIGFDILQVPRTEIIYKLIK